jgi:hypothetical protein
MKLDLMYWSVFFANFSDVQNIKQEKALKIK